MPLSYGYILNRRPFRESSLLVDLFTEDFGRICCVARPAKKRGKVIKGNLEPFRYLELQWLGKGDVQTLTQVEEHGRHDIPASELMLGLYLNELLLLLTRQHVPMPNLFKAYKYTLHKLSDPEINQQIVMRFELYLLESLGHSINSESLQSEQAISSEIEYLFSPDEGIQEDGIGRFSGISISGELLLSLQDMTSMQTKHWKLLRQFLDEVFRLLSPRTINTRKLLKR